MLLIANELRRYPVAGANVSFEAPGVPYSIGMNAIPWWGLKPYLRPRQQTRSIRETLSRGDDLP